MGEDTGKCACKTNVIGDKCEFCTPGNTGFPSCHGCTCNAEGSAGNNCDSATGHCFCHTNIVGDSCDECAIGSFNFPTCEECGCSVQGSVNSTCDATGQCVCKDTFTGDKCEDCAAEHYNIANSCHPCNCNEDGSVDQNCNARGKCTCKENVIGDKCDQIVEAFYDITDPNECNSEYYGFPTCYACMCDEHGAVDDLCDDTTGKCTCKDSFANDKCSECIEGFFGYPNCQGCPCNAGGSENTACDTAGKCTCKANVIGRDCDSCEEGYYGFPDCQACQCNLDGSEDGNCGTDGQCSCKENIAGAKCDQCQEGYSMNGFPTCQKEIRIKFHVINALNNKGIEAVTVKATGSSQGLLSGITDEGGFATVGPFVPGESITVHVANNGFDDVEQVITATEGTDKMMLGMNPTGPDIRLILTWGPSPSDL